MTLYPYQVEGVRRLVNQRCVLFADDMGLGKTVQAAVAMRQLFDADAIRRVLVVCPVSIMRNWRKEIVRWAPGLPAVLYEGAHRYGMLEGNARILIGSYETITEDLRRPTCNGRAFCDIGLDLLVLDEAQRIKAPGSFRSRILSRILSARRWALSGTPLENHPRDLNSILRFLFPNEYATGESINDLELMLQLRTSCLMRRTKDEVEIQLPARTVSYIPVQLCPDQASEYEQTLANVRSSLVGARSKSAVSSGLLAGLQKLRRITAVSGSGSSAKLDLISDELEVLAELGEKTVVFSSYANLALPVALDRLKRYRPVLFTGAMTQHDRELAHRSFTDNPNCLVMCASLRSAGVGLTWTVARHVYHLDLWWNPQAIRQAEDRVHRIGQRQPVFLRRLVAERTIDEGIVSLLESKDDLFRFVIDGAAPTPREQRLDSLLNLVGLRRQDLEEDALQD